MVNYQPSKCILSLPCTAQGYLKNTCVGEIYYTAIETRLQMIVCVSFTVEVRSDLISTKTQLCCDGIHASMRKTVFYCTKAIKCCTHNVLILFCL